MQARARVPRAQFGEQGISNWSDLEADDVGVEGVEEAAERAVLRHPRPQPVHVVSHYLQHLPPPPRGVTPGTGHAEAREGNVSLFSGAGAGRREPAAGAAAAPVVVGTGDCVWPRQGAAAAGDSGAARASPQPSDGSGNW